MPRERSTVISLDNYLHAADHKRVLNRLEHPFVRQYDVVQQFSIKTALKHASAPRHFTRAVLTEKRGQDDETNVLPYGIAVVAENGRGGKI